MLSAFVVFCGLTSQFFRTFGEMYAGGKATKKGLRCRVSPTCTFSQNGYGDSQRLQRTRIAVKVRGLMNVARGKNMCPQRAMQQRHLWDSNPRGQSPPAQQTGALTTRSWKHQNQCPSLRLAFAWRCRSVFTQPNTTQPPSSSLPFLLASMFSHSGEMCQHLDVFVMKEEREVAWPLVTHNKGPAS